MNGFRSVIARALAAGAILLALTGAARAHAMVVETIPADGAVLDHAPDRIVIRFNELVAPILARLLDATGRDVTPADGFVLHDRELRLALPLALAAGTYVATFRVVSADSHPIGGSIVFSIGPHAAHASLPAVTLDDSGWRAAMVIVRAILYAGVLGGAGGVLFLLLVRPAGAARRSAARIAARFATVGICAGLLAIGVQGGLLTAVPLSGLVRAETWWIGLTSRFGLTAVAATCALALIAACIRHERSAVAGALAYAGAAGALASFALSGHVVTAEPRWLTPPVLILHTAIVAFWIGALLPLRHAIGALGADAAPIVQRFSRLALWAVPILIVAGLTIAVVQVPSVGGLLDTTYGLILLLKLALVAGLLALAAINKLRLTPAFAGGSLRSAIALRRTIAAEIGLSLAILAATAGLGTTPPPRTLHAGGEDHAVVHAGQGPEGLWVQAASGDGRVEIALATARSGIHTAYVRLANQAGIPIEAKEVIVIATNASAGVEPIQRTAEATPSGAWRVDRLALVPAGRWRLRVDVLVGDFEKLIFEAEIDLH